MKTTLRLIAVSISVLLAGLPAAAAGGKGAKGAKPSVGVTGGPAGEPTLPVGAVKGAPVKGDAAKKAEEENPVNALAKLLVDKELGSKVKESAAKRIADFMLSGDGGKGSFVKKESRDNGAGERLRSVAKKWVDQTFVSDVYKDKAPVAELYYVLGEPDKLPDWAAKHPVLKDNLKGFESHKLSAGLGGYTGEAAKPGQFGTGQFSDTAEAQNWPFTFFDDAAKVANNILKDRRTKDQKETDIKAGEERSSVPPGPPQKPAAGASAGFDLDALFVQGARVENLYQEGDATSRRISMKMHTAKDKDGVYNDLAICDITYASDVYCRTFRVDPNAGSRTFALDDRQPGMRQYTLSMTPNRDGNIDIKFGRPKNADQLGSDLRDLSRRRAEQAVQTGNIRSVGGQDYFVLGQSAGTGDLLFFPTSIAGKLNDVKTENLSPELVATVVSMKDGRPLVAQKPHLGTVRGKEFHLRYNPDLGYYEVGEGPGEAPWKPEDPAKPDGGTGKPDGDKPDGGKPDGGNGGTINPDDPNGVITRGEYELDTDNNNALNEDLKKKIKIYKITPKGIEALKNDVQGKMKRYIIIFPKDMISRQFIYANYMAGTKEFGALLVLGGKYAATESDLGSLYVDFSRKEIAKDKEGKDIEVPLVVGYSVKENSRIEKLTVKSLLSDAMERAGFKGDEVKAAKENLAKVTGSEEKVSISGARALTLVVTFGGKSVAFWPTIGESKPDPGDGGHSGTTGASGSTAFDGAQGGQPDTFQDTGEVGNPIEKLTVFRGLKKSNAVLYVNEVEKDKGTNAKPRKWYLMFNFKNQGKLYRTKYVEIMGEKGKDLFDFPYASEGTLDINADGLTKHAVETSITDTAILRLVGEKADAAKGVYAGFASRGEQIKDKKANCLGPVLWWGMNQAAAQKACETNSY